MSEDDHPYSLSQMLTFNFAYRQCKISNPRPGLTPGTALRAVGSGNIHAAFPYFSGKSCWLSHENA